MMINIAYLCICRIQCLCKIPQWKDENLGEWGHPKKGKRNTHKHNPPIVARHGHHQFSPQNDEVTQGTYLQTEAGTTKLSLPPQVRVHPPKKISSKHSEQKLHGEKKKRCELL